MVLVTPRPSDGSERQAQSNELHLVLTASLTAATLHSNQHQIWGHRAFIALSVILISNNMLENPMISHAFGHIKHSQIPNVSIPVKTRIRQHTSKISIVDMQSIWCFPTIWRLLELIAYGSSNHTSVDFERAWKIYVLTSCYGIEPF